MGFFKKKSDKPSPEERILDTKIQLGKLKEKYGTMMEMERRVLQNNPTPHEKEMAESKISSGLCAITICNQALKDLNEIDSELDLNKSMKSLNKSLKMVNRLGRKARGGYSKKSLSNQVTKIKEYEDKRAPQDIFSDEALGAVDDWLGSKWDSLAGKYIAGESLESCLNESRFTLESAPMPFMDSDVFGGSGGKGGMEEDSDIALKDLLNSDIF